MMLIDSSHAFYYYSSFARAREECFGFWLFEHTSCACVKKKPYTMLIYTRSSFKVVLIRQIDVLWQTVTLHTS